MKNKKHWLIIKGSLIVLFTLIVVAMPTEDVVRKWLRFIMLAVFVFSFIRDLIIYKRDNG